MFVFFVVNGNIIVIIFIIDIINVVMISCKGHILSQQHQQWQNKHTLVKKMHNDFLFTWFLGFLMFVLFLSHLVSLHIPLLKTSSELVAQVFATIMFVAPFA